MSTASTFTPRRAAGRLSAPLPDATSKNCMPGFRHARRRAVLAKAQLAVGVTYRSKLTAMPSQASRVFGVAVVTILNFFERQYKYTAAQSLTASGYLTKV